MSIWNLVGRLDGGGANSDASGADCKSIFQSFPQLLFFPELFRAYTLPPEAICYGGGYLFKSVVDRLRMIVIYTSFTLSEPCKRIKCSAGLNKVGELIAGTRPPAGWRIKLVIDQRETKSRDLFSETGSVLDSRDRRSHGLFKLWLFPGAAAPCAQTRCAVRRFSG